MKRLILSFAATLLIAIGAKAMDYEEAKQRAWFLTDKMAYELNLTPEQCDRAYEVNLDYLMNVRTANELTGNYWTYRNNDLRLILTSTQYTLFAGLDYFFHPLRWLTSGWHFPVYNRYYHTCYYFSRPIIVNVYRGGHYHDYVRYGHSHYRNFRITPNRGMCDRYYAGRREDHRPRYDQWGHRQNWSKEHINDKGFPSNRPERNDNQGFHIGNNKNNKPESGRDSRVERENRPNQNPGFHIGNGNNTRPAFDRNTYPRNNERNEVRRLDNTQSENNTPSRYFNNDRRGRESSTRITVERNNKSNSEFNRMNNGNRSSINRRENSSDNRNSSRIQRSSESRNSRSSDRSRR